MLGFLRKLFRPDLSNDEQYVEDTDKGKLFNEMRGQCPDCKLKPPVWLEGPSGGMCINIFCGRCGSGFNITPVVQIAERIGTNPRYILPEYEPDTSDIPEANEDWFRKARLKRKKD